MDDSLATFADPPREFSVLPSWFWNDKLDAEEIRRQIGDFGARGVHGFVIHPCVGRRGGEIVYVVPDGAEHSEKAVARCRIPGVFQPLREEYVWEERYNEIGDPEVTSHEDAELEGTHFTIDYDLCYMPKTAHIWSRLAAASIYGRIIAIPYRETCWMRGSPFPMLVSASEAVSHSPHVSLSVPVHSP
ncbi:MAG: hypothetical protein F4X62_10405 [Caldilineaceae bacterium SB0662_bin_25]|nr:hypothetical protein [Caldilineaceae bacterium SB0662_bin_25]